MSGDVGTLVVGLGLYVAGVLSGIGLAMVAYMAGWAEGDGDARNVDDRI